MSTLEYTISLLETMPEEKLKEVQSVSDLACGQYDKFLDYIYHTLLNPQAADRFGYCKSECLCLRQQGFIRFIFNDTDIYLCKE